jgi:serine/threonine protein kinase
MLKKGTVLSTTFDEYIAGEQISQGGNGTVFSVQNTNREPLAIKAIDRANTSKGKLKRFKNELSFCQNNVHPHIIHVVDHGAFKQGKVDVIFYVMPYYPVTLRQKILDGLMQEEAFRLFIQLLNALSFAHTEKVWHRDIKPENILIDDCNNAVLADFGIAHFCSEEMITEVKTKATDRLANFQYSAPEQRAKGEIVNGTADIFAAGLILNEMFTGKIIGGSALTRIADVNTEWAYLDEVIDAMIVQDPTQRLYPVEKILFRLEVLAASGKVKGELKKLNASHENSSDEFLSLDTPKRVGVDYNR